MKALTIFVLSATLCFSCLVSCQSKIENAQTKTIDSLLIALEDAEEELESIDFEKMEVSAKTAKENLDKIKPMVLDTLNRDKIFLMSNYAIVAGEEGEEEAGGTASSENNEAYEEVREKYIEKELALCTKQLKNLKNDFVKGDMDEASFKKYFEVEQSKALQIITFIQMEKNATTHKLAIYDSLHPLILKFIDSLQIATHQQK